MSAFTPTRTGRTTIPRSRIDVSEFDIASGLVPAVLAELSSRKVFAWRSKAMFDTGVSYIVGMSPGGRFIAVECRFLVSGGLSQEQQVYQGRVRANNGIVILAHSADDVRRGLNELGVN